MRRRRSDPRGRARRGTSLVEIARDDRRSWGEEQQQDRGEPDGEHRSEKRGGRWWLEAQERHTSDLFVRAATATDLQPCVARAGDGDEVAEREHADTVNLGDDVVREEARHVCARPWLDRLDEDPA